MANHKIQTNWDTTGWALCLRASRAVMRRSSRKHDKCNICNASGLYVFCSSPFKWLTSHKIQKIWNARNRLCTVSHGQSCSKWDKKTENNTLDAVTPCYMVWHVPLDYRLTFVQTLRWKPRSGSRSQISLQNCWSTRPGGPCSTPERCTAALRHPALLPTWSHRATTTDLQL